MSHKARFAIQTIEFPQKKMSDVIALLSKAAYTDEAGIGILDLDNDDAQIDVVLMKRVPTFLNEYNFEQREYQKQQVYLYNQIKFTIDFSFGILYCLGPRGNLSIVKLFLKQHFGSLVDTQILEFTTYGIYTKLRKQKVRFKIDDITIDRFNFNDGAIGKFTAKIVDNQVVKELFAHYKSDLSKIVFSVNTQNVNFMLHIFNNGVVGIVSDDEDTTNDAFNFLKSILFNHA